MSLENKENTIKLFPNPVKDVLYIEKDATSLENTKIRIVNIASQDVYFRAIEGNKISLLELPAGSYILEIPKKEGNYLYYKVNKVK